MSAILKRKQFALDTMRAFDPETADMDLTELLASAVIKQARDLDAWPLCQHHDARGHCKGHPQ